MENHLKYNDLEFYKNIFHDLKNIFFLPALRKVYFLIISKDITYEIVLEIASHIIFETISYAFIVL